MAITFRTCEVCGEESPDDGTGIWTVLEGPKRWVHRGACFLEYGLATNAPTPTYRSAVERLGIIHRGRAAELVVAERLRVRRELREWLIGRLDERDAGLVNGRRIADEIDRICPTHSPAPEQEPA